jgi:hypothetical protein
MHTETYFLLSRMDLTDWFLVYLISSFQVQNIQWQDDCEDGSESVWKEAVVACFKVKL